MSNIERRITKDEFCEGCTALTRLGNCRKAIREVTQQQIVNFGWCAMGTDRVGLPVTRVVIEGRLHVRDQVNDY